MPATPTTASRTACPSCNHHGLDETVKRRRIGTAEVATDPMGIELTDVFVTLKPRGEWKRARTQEEFVERLDELVHDLPGQNLAFTQPIEMRMNEMIAGIRSDIGIKVYGDDLTTLTRLSDAIQGVLVDLPGATDVSGEQISGQPVLEVKADPKSVGRFGIPIRNVLNVVEAVGGKEVGEIREGQRRFPLVVRLPERLRQDPGALASTLIPTEEGSVVPLGRVANVVRGEGPSTLNREWGRRRTVVQVVIATPRGI